MSNKRAISPALEDKVSYDPEKVFQAGLRNHHISNTAYPIAHQTVWAPYKVSRRDYKTALQEAFSEIDPLCLYVHIPFCETRCYFCEYTVVGGKDLNLTREYTNWLLNEFRLYRELLETKSRTLVGFDIGGGTPSFLDSELIEEIVCEARSSFQFAPGAEISIETTPKIASSNPEKIAAYRKMGIDRISMGIQVTQPDLLRILNRSANGLEHLQRAMDNIRTAGFKKVNVDLMYGFADQSLESWKATLQQAIELNPEYVTLYRMRYKLTRISDQAHRVSLDDVHEQAALAKIILKQAGYIANPGKNTYSRIVGDPGTSDYLTQRVVHGRSYLGLGLGSQSMTNTSISYNDGSVGKNFAPYQRAIERGEFPIQDLYTLPIQHMAAKMCAVSFYFGEVNLTSFKEKFGVTLEEVYPAEVEYVLKNNLMQYTDTTLNLTQQGAFHFNGVIALFFAPSVKRYLIERDPNAAQDFTKNEELARKVSLRQAA